jgi:hypothetical protein
MYVYEDTYNISITKCLNFSWNALRGKNGSATPQKGSRTISLRAVQSRIASATSETGLVD